MILIKISSVESKTCKSYHCVQHLSLLLSSLSIFGPRSFFDAQITDEGVSLVENLELEREPMAAMEAIYFVVSERSCGKEGRANEWARASDRRGQSDLKAICPLVHKQEQVQHRVARSE